MAKAVKKKKSVTKAPKEAKKSTKEKPVKAEKKAKAKKPAVWVSKVVTAADMTSKTKKLLKEADAIELKIADAQDEFQEKLKELRTSLETSNTFEHPDRGAMTIMTRGEKTFWRSKPSGSQ